MSIRLIEAPISISFSEYHKEEHFDREFEQLSEADDDPINAWLKKAKAKGETQESDKVLLNLIVELHRKVDNLERLLKNEEPNRLQLEMDEDIIKIGFEHFQLKEASFTIGKVYYGRLEMPVHPKRDVCIYFKALDTTTAKIMRMHERDQNEWNAYVTARERVMIRKMKAKKS